jgi:hypothetical protein
LQIKNRFPLSIQLFHNPNLYNYPRTLPEKEANNKLKSNSLINSGITGPIMLVIKEIIKNTTIIRMTII